MLVDMTGDYETARAAHLELARLVGHLEHTLDELERDGFLSELDDPTMALESVQAYRDARAAITIHFDADRPAAAGGSRPVASGAGMEHWGDRRRANGVRLGPPLT